MLYNISHYVLNELCISWITQSTTLYVTYTRGTDSVETEIRNSNKTEEKFP